ncbi:hypothetical protein WI38_09350 [Burkholderia ubonensis]|uniref:Uncharacterized protein n=1 Tax=Burkholderia ubonensis TaxID=101571 RepID=A0A102LH25_9BURK|nr:hypothetical protein [Burkholderia ubonensis]KUZ76491.1 hypothetical protein WI35_07280 [Burkholderia ubonensis]KUZ93236.1 hypothetical protein WI39_16090 [Burkholderia ubonensis]KUZ93477.1 hypothetical protein WI38_09350 [Burkholderia ubonensis]
MATDNNLTINLLRVLRYRTPAGIPFDELVRLAYSNLPSRSQDGDEPSVRVHSTRRRHARMILDELMELGIIVERGENGLLALATPIPGERIDGGSGNPPPPGNDAGAGDGDDGGSGLGQVLAHPILFAYSDEDFDQALDNALERFE